MQDAEDRRDAQFDPHNKQPANARRIRLSLIMVALMFTALALTAMIIAYRP
ncbi:MAG TPA: hypothetical protein VKT81_04340 [Bryobacteraceae bacterium]|nr:hypothetical protein [Bryobacteraceae bacterium]